MLTLVPRLHVQIEPKGYRLLELTVNPVLPSKGLVARSAGIVPVYIEFVIGHDADGYLDPPTVVIQLTPQSAFAGEVTELSLDCSPLLLAAEGRPQRNVVASLSLNRDIYSHFFYPTTQGRDPLPAAYGATSTRLTTPANAPRLKESLSHIRAARVVEDNDVWPGTVAIRRQSVVHLPTDQRTCYPCSFSGSSERKKEEEVEITLQPTLLAGSRNSIEVVPAYQLRKQEAVSFWWSCAWRKDSESARAPMYFVEHFDETPFSLHIAVHGEAAGQAKLNYFPRIPDSHSIIEAVPPLVRSPHLIREPEEWARVSPDSVPYWPGLQYELAKVATFEADDQNLFFSLRTKDERLVRSRELAIATFTMFLALTLDKLVPDKLHRGVVAAVTAVLFLIVYFVITPGSARMRLRAARENLGMRLRAFRKPE